MGSLSCPPPREGGLSLLGGVLTDAPPWVGPAPWSHPGALLKEKEVPLISFQTWLEEARTPVLALQNHRDDLGTFITRVMVFVGRRHKASAV